MILNATESLNITTAFLLGIIGFISLVLILLILFEGRTNARIKLLLKKLEHLQGDMQDKDEKLERLNNLINEHNRELQQHYHQHLDHHLDTFSHKHRKYQEFHIIQQSSGLLQKLGKLWQRLRQAPYFSEAYVVSYLITLLGTVILGLGLTFYVKFTLSQEVFNVTGKVIIGISSSALLIAIGHIFHKRSKVFSSILLGGALAVLYYTFALTYYQYQLMGDLPTLAIMAVVTSFAIGLSLAYRQQMLAFLALAAAFTAPFMVNFSPENYIVLFSYILVIDLGVLVLAFFRKWTLLYVITNIFTVAFYALWMINALQENESMPFPGSFIYLSSFYLIFVLVHITWKVRTSTPFLPIELTFVISNTLLYYTGGYILLNTISSAYDGLFTALIALVNFIFLFVLHLRQKAHYSLKYAFFGLAVIFLVLIPPIELVGRSITLIWSFQIVLLLWVAQKIDVVVMRLGALSVSIILAVSLGIDMWNMYVETSSLSDPMPLFLNIGFITNLAGTVGFTINMLLLNREQHTYFIPFVKVNALKGFFGMMALAAFYLTFYLELRYHLLQSLKAENIIRLYINIYNTGLIALAASAVLFKRIKALGWVSLLLGGVAVVTYLLYFHYLFIDVRNDYLTGNLVTLAQYRMHYLIIALFVYILACIHTGARAIWHNTGKLQASRFIVYVLLVVVLSSEADHIFVIQRYHEGLMPSAIAEEVHKLIYTILWSALASVTTIGGMLAHRKNWRNLGYVFFVGIAGKLLFYDLPAIEPNQQVIAFITVGGSIVITTLIYHILQPRLNKAVKDETEK